MQALLEPKKTPNSSNPWSFIHKSASTHRSPQSNPNTIDVDALYTSDWETLCKLGAYFYCKKRDHIAVSCPKKPKTNNPFWPLSTTFSPTSSSTTTPKGIFHIKALLIALSDKEKEELMASMEQNFELEKHKGHLLFSFLPMYMHSFIK